RNLVGGATHATALHLELRLDVVEGLAEHLDGVLLEAIGDDVERAVEGALGGRLLAILHDGVDELRDQLVLVLRVGKDLALRNFTAAGHLDTPVRWEQRPDEQSVRTSGASRRTCCACGCVLSCSWSW